MENLFGLKMEKAIEGNHTPIVGAITKVRDCVDNNEKCKIKIVDGMVSGGNKEMVAITVEDHLLNLQDTGTEWYPQSYNDKNTERLTNYLREEFGNVGEWVINGSQDPFDTYNLNTLVAVELKSEKVSFSKRKNLYHLPKTIIGNATIYPTVAKIKDVVNKKDIDPSWNDEFLNSFMDVMVVIVCVDKRNNLVVDYRIVDGSYWGFNREDFVGCREYFSIINSELDNFNLYLSRKYLHNPFIQKITNGGYGNFVNLKIRKLISWKAPFDV